MNRKIFIAFSVLNLFIFSSRIFSQNTEWTVNSATVKFKIKNAGFTVDGSFSGVVAKINFDGAKSSGNSIEATLDAKSINTGNGTRDGDLRKAEYFNVAHDKR
jgi:polyisoprenoid-binding protein YceI